MRDALQFHVKGRTENKVKKAYSFLPWTGRENLPQGLYPASLISSALRLEGSFVLRESLSSLPFTTA